MNADDRTYVVMESGYYIDRHSGIPIVNLYSRCYEDPMVTATHSFPYEPYLYVPANEATKFSHPAIKRIEDEILLDYKHNEIRKVIVNIPTDVRDVRDLGYSFTRESDVLFDKRFLIDHKIRYAYKVIDNKPIPVEVDHPMDPLVMYFDIETWDNTGGFTGPKEATAPIVSIQIGNNYNDKEVVFTYAIGKSNDPDQFMCETEQELYQMVMAYIQELNPDILAAWNSDQFDIPYIINRAKILRTQGTLKKSLCRYAEPSTKITIYKKREQFRSYLPGRACLDMMEAFKKYNVGKGQRESNGLKSVISDKSLLKEAAYTYQDLGPIINDIIVAERWDDFIAYCKNDIKALKVIDKKLGLYKFFESIRFIAGNKITESLHNSTIIATYVRHEGIKPLPRRKYKGDDEDDGPKFPGALVVTPKLGVHEWVATVDLNSLYPHIILAYELSSDCDGIIHKSTQKLMDLREVYRDQKNRGLDGASARDSAAKALVNSIYGIMGAESSECYDEEKAAFVTATGQKINKHIQELVKLKGKSVIYGDTDSVFFSEVKTGSECLYFEKWLNEELVKWSDEQGCKIHFKLKSEKLFRRIIFKPKSNDRSQASKKKYAGHLIWEEGRDCDEFKFMGLEIKRSDNSIMTKQCLSYLLETTLLKGEVEKATKFVRDHYRSVLDGTANIYDISIPRELRKTNYNGEKNAWADGKTYALQHFNYTIQEGEKPRLVHLKHGETICIDDGFDTSQISHLVDWKLMAEKTIKKKLESYFWAVDIEWNTAIKGQTNLQKFGF